MTQKDYETLENGVRAIDPSLADERVLALLRRYFDEITVFNPTLGLVAAEGNELVVRHILDCLAPVPLFRKLLPAGSTIADLGSGSGLPGIVLAIAMPEYRFTLVERMGRRVGFLRNTVAMCRLTDRVTILQSDTSEVRSTFDCLTFRAFRQMRDIAADLDRMLATGGRILSFKSSDSNIAEEVSELEQAFPGRYSHENLAYGVPFLDAKRSLLAFTRLN